MTDLHRILSDFDTVFSETDEQRAAMERAKHPSHPWRARNPLNPPKTDDRIIPRHAREGIKA